MMAGVLAHAAAQKPAAPQQTVWTGSWAAAPDLAPEPKGPSAATDAKGTTYRDIVHLSLGGSALRLHISNEFGSAPLTIGGMHVALSAGAGGIVPQSDHFVTFGGAETVMIPAGAQAVSDPVAMPVAAFADLAVSIYVPQQPGAKLSWHTVAVSTNYIAAGNALTAATMSGAEKVISWYLLKGVDVDAGPEASAIVTLGDSITDGYKSSRDKNARWPDILAQRLHANAATAHIGVLDEGISGNRLLHDGRGPSVLSRLDRDVLAQSGAKYVIILIGINDIGHMMAALGKPSASKDPVTVDDLAWGLQQIVVRAHARGMKVYCATVTPYGGSGYQNDDGMKLHAGINHWIRTSGAFDGVIDFEKMMHDPANNKVFLAPYDSGDHLHPGDAGYKAMGDFIDLKLFQ
jgi:lysophospholipase L1-like esterase